MIIINKKTNRLRLHRSKNKLSVLVVVWWMVEQSCLASLPLLLMHQTIRVLSPKNPLQTNNVLVHTLVQYYNTLAWHNRTLHITQYMSLISLCVSIGGFKNKVSHTNNARKNQPRPAAHTHNSSARLHLIHKKPSQGKLFSIVALQIWPQIMSFHCMCVPCVCH